MNKRMYQAMLDLAGKDLMKQILSELSETKKLRECPSYAELSDFCKALNLVALWSGEAKVTPRKLVQEARDTDEPIRNALRNFVETYGPGAKDV